MDSNDKDFTETPTRLDKTLSWLKLSRDCWKEKTRESKTKLKIATLGIKRARESRDEIEKELHSRQKQLDQKDVEISILKKKLEQAAQEVETLKKKR
jgi:chromosome segregation ATPase